MHIDKKIMVISILAAVIVVLPVFSPSILSTAINNEQKILIETRIHKGYGEQRILTECTVDEVEYLKTCLVNLNDAIERQDMQNIIKYESILCEKGILDDYQIYGFQCPMLRVANSVTNGDISNTFCYFHAVGEGIMIFTVGVLLGEYLQRILSNASSIWEAIAIGVVLLPFFLIVFLVTHLVPFRILLSTGVVEVENGVMSTLGLSGYRHIDVTDQHTATINWFTGVTISIPSTEGSDAFLFVSGFALSVV